MQRLQGYWYKTLNVPTAAGVRTYQFRGANTNDLDLPPDSVVLGIFARRFSDSGDKDYEGNNLVNSTVNARTWFSLVTKDRDFQGAPIRDLVKQYSYQFLSNPPLYFEKKIVTDIDWSHSPIEISSAVASTDIVDDEVFEFIIVYAPRTCLEIAENYTFRTGEIYEKERFLYLEIPTRANQQTFRISNQNSVGIDDNAIVIGLDLRPNRNFSGLGELNSTAQKCGFLNLYQKTYQFVDNLPIALDGIPQGAFNKPYLPIAPIRVKDIAWERSNLFFSDISAVADDEAFNFGIVYTYE